MNDDVPVPYNRNAIRPMQCLREGWELIKDQYWLFVGISLFASFIAGAGPLGILAGPMTCGLYYCIFQRAEGKEVNFNMLFKGFDYFIPCLAPAIVMTCIVTVLFLGAYFAFLIGLLSTLAALGPPPGGQPEPAFFGVFFGLYGAFFLFIIAVDIVIRTAFFFTFPLVMDRRLSGWDAMRLGFQATRDNLTGVLAVVLLMELLGLVSLAFCCVGPILELPINVAMLALAYRQVFPQRNALEDFATDHDRDDDTPRGSGPSSTEVRAEETR